MAPVDRVSLITNTETSSYRAAGGGVVRSDALLLRLALVHDVHHGSLGLLTGAEA